MNINIRLSNVSKAYKDHQLLNNISYEFTKNVYHIVGKNGVGKSTLLRLLVGLETPDSGNIIINDHKAVCDHNLMAKNISYIPDDLEIYPFLTGKEFINWIAQARSTDSDNIDNIIDSFNLKKHLNTRVSDMSFGTKKKFLITTAFMGTPDFIILDEPMNGLDQSSQSVCLSILEEKSKKSGIILTCHEEDKIAVLHPYTLEILNKKLTELTLENNSLI